MTDPRQAPAENGDIEAIRRITADGRDPFVPSLSDYVNPSAGWNEVEYRVLDMASRQTMVGYWTGEPGEVSFDAWPYAEVYSILSGRVAVRSASGDQMDFGPGEGFIVPRGWKGTWVTIETSPKIFIAIS